MRSARLLIASLLLVAGLAAHAQGNPRVQVETSMGKFVIELDPERAPLTVANFLQYVREGFYSGVIFHRVISNFIAQARPVRREVRREETARHHPQRVGQRPVEPARHGRPGAHRRTRTAATRSSTSTSRTTALLDPQPTRWGYTVFGKVVDGMNVVDDIGQVATGQAGPIEKDAPLKPVIIIRIEELKSAP